jgi:hypothetical protein
MWLGFQHVKHGWMIIVPVDANSNLRATPHCQTPRLTNAGEPFFGLFTCFSTKVGRR